MADISLVVVSITGRGLFDIHVLPPMQVSNVRKYPSKIQ